MILKEQVALAPYTTFHLGGPARFFIEAHSEAEIVEGIAFAHDRDLPLFPLGGGSNVLMPDEGIEAVVLRLGLQESFFEKDGDDTLLVADAGVSWDAVVTKAVEKELFGIENLAGIPGTLGGAVVQNIGAYGTELSNCFEYADAISAVSGERRRFGRSESAFAYRNSVFKEWPEWIVIRATLRLTNGGVPNLSYPDLARARTAGQTLGSSREIAEAIRAIRAGKFPSALDEGTAGSFFKNPVLRTEEWKTLHIRFPDLPSFPQADGRVKVSLAWLLDHALALKGYARGGVRLYEKQPLVVVAREGATAADVRAFAEEISERVRAEIGLSIEREVEFFSEKKIRTLST